MKHMAQLIMALVLAALAAGANFLWMNSKRDYPEYVCVSQPVKKGEIIDPQILVSLPMPGDPEEMKKTFIPWADGGLVARSIATRDYLPGMLVLHDDLPDVQSTPSFQELGPFELVTVGSTPVSSAPSAPAVPSSTRGENITIKVPATLDSQTQRLLRYLAGERGRYFASETEDEKKLLDLVTVVTSQDPASSLLKSTLPKPSAGTGETAAEQPLTEPGTRLMHIPLDNLKVDRDVLLKMKTLYFIVPKGLYADLPDSQKPPKVNE